VKTLRQLSSLVGVVAMVALGVLLVSEATNAISGQWRSTLARRVETIADPQLPPWQLALIGAGLAVLSLILVVAEFTRPPKGTRILHSVHDTSFGSTEISGKAAMNAAKHELKDIAGVVAIDASMTQDTMTIIARLDDDSDLEAVEAAVRDRLDHEFWIRLGLADMAVNVLMAHQLNPPRVR
jgi:hypothetical protein